MRTTIRLDEGLMRELAERARQEHVSVDRLIGRLLLSALRQERAEEATRPRFRERPRGMGAPRLELTKALELAARREDAETARELTTGR
jgi:hypothetical protein